MDGSKSRVLAGAASSNLWKRMDQIVPVVLLLFVLGFYQHVQYRDYGLIADSLVYLSGAQGLASGEGYRFIAHEATPKITTYPPGMSVLLAAVWSIGPDFPENGFWLNQVAIVGAMTALIAGFVVLRRVGMPGWLGALMMSVVGTSPLWCQWVFWLMSDFLFMGLAILGMLWANRVWRRERRIPWMWLGVWVASLLWLRSAALGLWAGLLLVSVIVSWRASKWYWPAILVAGVISIGLWKLWTAGEMGYATIYGRHIAHAGGPMGYATVVLKNVGWMLTGDMGWEMLAPSVLRITGIAGEASPVAGAFLSQLMGPLMWLVFLLAIRGVAVSGPFTWAAAAVWMVYCVQVIVTPNNVWHNHRYLYPFVPLVLAAVWMAIPPGWRKHCRWLAVPLLLVLLLNVRLTPAVLREHEARSALSELKETAVWVVDNIPEEARIASDLNLPCLHFYAWSGRRLVVDDLVDPRVELPHVPRSRQLEGEVDFLIAGVDSTKDDAPSGMLEEVFRSEHGAYRVLRLDRDLAGEYRRMLKARVP